MSPSTSLGAGQPAPLSLSIVTSLYQSEEFLTEFHAR